MRTLSDIRRVLIVDDNRDSAELLALLLERAGHQTRVAHDGPEAIAVASLFCPNIAFLDIGLPGMDGYQLMSLLRVRPELSECRFVAVTGYEQLSPSSDGATFDAHLLKPIDLDVVVRLVNELTASEPTKQVSA